MEGSEGLFCGCLECNGCWWNQPRAERNLRRKCSDRHEEECQTLKLCLHQVGMHTQVMSYLTLLVTLNYLPRKKNGAN